MQSESGDDLVFKVKPGSDARKVGSALAHSIVEGKTVVLRAIGAGAIQQAQKAVAAANGWVAPRGILLATIPGWEDAEDRDGKRISVLAFRVIEVH